MEANTSQCHRAAVLALDWTRERDLASLARQEPFDLLLAADVLYDPKLFGPLLALFSLSLPHAPFEYRQEEPLRLFFFFWIRRLLPQ